ncbi:hypothetical protein [Amycolatopsis sp.]|jgi:hypothetical protein|uniref:hypothetical protein n=1 Tax=Amycolatopsis sp. TaxID=37632 RepID=UPI002DFF9265|nr:hypothetical protein [Amycolatopsis sp.]
MSSSSKGRHRKRTMLGMAGILAAAGIAVGVVALNPGASDSQAAESCQGLDTALQNNLSFIADQQRTPDALSTARIANRQDVVNLIQQRRAVAGCTAAVGPVGAPVVAAPAAPAPAKPAAPAAGQPATGGDVVCAGSTVTLFNEDAAPGAASNQFPLGTKLKVTNLDNNKATTVAVTSTSGSCVILNNAAFENVREPGKFLIRRAKIERVG